jgi:predicted Zn-dependent peptidase
MSQQQIKEKLYNIATTFRIGVSGDETVVTIEGLTENMLEALDIVEDVLTNACLDEKVLENIKQKLLKERAEAKSAQQQCFSRLSSYALYGKKNAHRTLLSDKEIEKLTAKQLCEQIKGLKQYKEQITYYGDLNLDAVEDYMFKRHRMMDKPSKVANVKPSEKQKISKNKVYFVNYPANQSYCRMFIVGDKYDESQRAVVAMYNEYFGGSMNSIVFQEMREKRSLAYQASSRYLMGYDKNDKNYNLSHIATQNDKVVEAFDAFNSLLDSMPAAEANFDLAKQALLKSIATNRTTKQGIISSYLNDKKYERQAGSMQKYYEQLQTITFEDIKAFSETKLKGQKRVYVILGSKEQINFDEVKKFGDIEELTLEEIFGY